MWQAVQDVNRAANEACIRASDDGTLRSRPMLSKHLLAGFLSHGVCHGSMHVWQGKYFLCTRWHLYGKRKCPNARKLKAAQAENALMTAFEEALIGATVLDTLEQVLDEIRRSQVDPAP